MPGQNDYPSTDNYPDPSFKTPVPLPLVPPDEGEQILVAYNPAWIPVLVAAAQQLLLPSTWQGDHDTVIDALNEASLLIFQLTEPAGTSGVPTPFWDEGQDLDDQASESEQSWYGEVDDPEAPADDITFIENVGIWAITGFIAYSGQIGAAIFFHSIAPSFVLAFHRGDVGEIWRVIVDAADYGTVDTSSATENDVVEMRVIGSEAGSDITIVKVG